MAADPLSVYRNADSCLARCKALRDMALGIIPASRQDQLQKWDELIALMKTTRDQIKPLVTGEKSPVALVVVEPNVKRGPLTKGKKKP